MFIDFIVLEKLMKKINYLLKLKEIIILCMNYCIFKIFKLENINEYFIAVSEHISIYYKHAKYLRYKPKIQSVL